MIQSRTPFVCIISLSSPTPSNFSISADQIGRTMTVISSEIKKREVKEGFLKCCSTFDLADLKMCFIKWVCFMPAFKWFKCLPCTQIENCGCVDRMNEQRESDAAEIGEARHTNFKFHPSLLHIVCVVSSLCCLVVGGIWVDCKTWIRYKK